MKNLKKYFLLSGFLSSVFITNIYAGSAPNQNAGLALAQPLANAVAKLIGNLGNNNNSGDSTTGNIGGLGPLGNVLGGNNSNASLVPTGQQAPTLSQTVPVIVDPSTGKNTVIDPSTGQPAKIDPTTGLASITDPKTGLSLAANPQTGQVLHPDTGQPASVYNITINNNVNNANNSVNNNIDIAQNKLPEGYALAPAAVAQQSVDAQGKPITLIQAVKKDTNETIYLQQQTDEQGQKTLHEVHMDGRTVPVSMPPQQEESLYDVLGVSPSATPQQIKAAYNKMALQHRSDKNLNDPAAAERFKKILNAYSVLNNPQGKASYDRKREEAAVHANSPSVGMPGGVNPAMAPTASDAEIDDVLSHPYDNERNMRLYKQFMEEAAKDPLKKESLDHITDEMPEKYVISTRKALLIDVARKIMGQQKQQEFMAQHQQTQQRQAEMRQRQEQENAQKEEAQRKSILEKQNHVSSLIKELRNIDAFQDALGPTVDETLEKYPNLINEYHAQNGAAGAATQQYPDGAAAPMPESGMMPSSTFEPATVPSSPISPAPVQQSWDAPATSSPAPSAEPASELPAEPTTEPSSPISPAAPVGLFAPAPQAPTITPGQLLAITERFKAARLNGGS